MTSSSSPVKRIAIIGGGLAGCEAALQLANDNIPVTLFEMKPVKRSPAHHSDDFAEIVCSNSFGNIQRSTASGLLKEELRHLDCQLIAVADTMSVPAGNALAVDREKFAAEITRRIQTHPFITCVAEEINDIPTDMDFVLIATGPLTSAGLAEALQNKLQQKQLYFFDAAAPILMADSINFEIAFYQNRYAHERTDDVDSLTTDDSGSYINCPLEKTDYEALIQHILSAEKAAPKAFEAAEAVFFESCLPIEVLAQRGIDTPRFGPMKPVGIVDPKTRKRPYAVVQLRQDNASGTLYNIVGFQTHLKWGEQKTMIHLIPGLENAEIVRYGVMHRNTFLNSPEVLQPTMQLKRFPHILIGGQLTGVEGYTESIASGLMASLTLKQLLRGNAPIALPTETMLGSLFHYITRSDVKNFQPINSNWGILPPLPEKMKDKKRRNELLADRALRALSAYMAVETSRQCVPACLS